MDQSESNMDNTVLITSEALLPIVNRYFDRISVAQWSMLGAGTSDSATEATLADMFTDIVQTLSTTILRIVLPIFQKRMLGSTSQADINTALENFNTPLGDSLPDSFAVALQVPQDKCESAEKLTALVESEILQKVTSIVTLAINSTVWPEKPAIFVTGSMSNVTSLHQMVFHATKCLRRYLGKLNSQCLGLCWRPKNIESPPHESSETTEQITETGEPEKCETPQSAKSTISVPSATKAVSDILTKWTTEETETTEEADDALLPLSTSLEAHYAASEIIRDIIDDLEFPDIIDVARCNVESCSRGPHFNLGLLVNKVRDFFATQAAPLDDANQRVRKRNYLKFAHEQFENVLVELKSKFETKHTDFLVSLECHSDSSQCRLIQDDTSDETPEDIIPGAVPESPKPKSESCSQTSKTPMISVRKELSSPLEFETIKNDVNGLFDKVNLPEKPEAHVGKTLDTSMYRVQIKTFSKELTDKMYSHLMTGQTYQIPVAPMGRSLSESVISEFSRKEGTGRFHFSPEVLYVMTEDAVGKFLQQVLLWLEKEPSNETSHSDKVSGALNDIADLITTMLTPLEENNVIERESLEASDRQTTTASCLSGVPPAKEAALSASLGTDDDCDGMNLRLHIDSRNIIKCNAKVASEVISPEETSDTALASSPYLPVPQNSQSLFSEESGGGLLAVSVDTSSPPTQRITKNLVTALVLRIITKAPWRARRSMQTADVNGIIKRLSDNVLGENIITDSDVRITEQNMKKLNKAVIKDLDQEFGSPKRILEAAMASNGTSFDDAVVKYLRVHLTPLLSPPPKSAVARFFSAVGKTLTKPFKWCIVGSGND